jgi:hypothetical protein
MIITVFRKASESSAQKMVRLFVTKRQRGLFSAKILLR